MQSQRFYIYFIIHTFYITGLFHIEQLNKIYLLSLPIIYGICFYAHQYGDIKTNIILIVEMLFSMLFRSYMISYNPIPFKDEKLNI